MKHSNEKTDVKGMKHLHKSSRGMKDSNEQKPAVKGMKHLHESSRGMKDSNEKLM